MPCTSRAVFTENMVTHYVDCQKKGFREHGGEKVVTGKMGPLVILSSNWFRFAFTLLIVPGGLEKVRPKFDVGVDCNGHTSFAF
jgi:hypothetical protein